MTQNDPKDTKHQWAQLRFSVIGQLLACPPNKLTVALKELADKQWQHPTQNKNVKFGYSTIERWYYSAKKSNNPIAILGRRSRSDMGEYKAMPEVLSKKLSEQFEDNPNWSWKLHADNLAAVARILGLSAPSYPTVRRYMQSKGWYKCRRTLNKTQGQLDAQTRLETREVRGYEVEYVHALWHLDFHHGSLRIPDKNGGWRNAECMCIMDDRSRLVCHIQWYYNETAENLIHALCQAFQKRGLPRKLMTDNGAAMVAAETVNGLLDLSIIHETTLPYSPYQNGKQESFWGQLEGRLLAMMQNDPEMTLTKLNYNTTFWVSQEYHHNRNRELRATPIEILTTGEGVDRPCPPDETLRFAFTHKVCRTQRRSDGTLSLENVRFEVPSHLRHINRLWVRYRRWDLSSAAIVDERDKTVILANIYPQDKTKNANGQRRLLESEPFKTLRPQITTSPLLEEILEKWKKTGLPAAYTPTSEEVRDAS